MPVIPTSNDPASIAAVQIKAAAVAAYTHLANVFATEARRFWRNPAATPAEIAAALGTDGVEVFRLHGAIGQLLASIDPAAIADAAAIVGQFQYGEDGTVAIVVPEPSPEPEPTPEPTPDQDAEPTTDTPAE